MNSALSIIRQVNREVTRIQSGATHAEMFYRDLLEQITQDPRKTRARRLAESGLLFWDETQREASKKNVLAKNLETRQNC